MDLNKIKKIYIIGIEGAGTSALARMLKKYQIEVSGSDEGDHFYYDVLEKEGIKVFHKFAKENIPRDIDLIIHSTAINPEDNEELKSALKSNVKVLKYPEALGMLSKQKFSIAVCGTHGKTTTTAWLAYVLEASGCSPSAIIGAKVPQLNGGTLVGSSEYFIFEADEYQNKLKHYQPKAVLLNNIEYDHPDFFKTVADYEAAFIEFIKKIPTKGFLLANFDDPVVEKIAHVNSRCRVISYGLANPEAELRASNISIQEGKQYFQVLLNNNSEISDLGNFSISLSGQHNVLNSLAVIGACLELGLDLFKIRTHLSDFMGVKGRMEKLGEYHGATVLIDYAHHPSEIKATLSGLRQINPRQKIIAVFQPHTFSRTANLLDEFASSFNDVNEVIINDIYKSREKEGVVHSRDLVAKILLNNPKISVKYIGSLDSCREYLKDFLKKDDILILMGAGNVHEIGEKLLK